MFRTARSAAGDITSPVRGGIDIIQELRIFGWAAGTRPGQERLALLADGHPVAAPVRRLARADVNGALGLGDDVLAGFEVDLPPAAWRHAGRPGRLSIQLLADGAPFGAAFELRAEDIAQLARQARETSGHRRDVLAGNAWMQARAAGVERALDPDTAAWLASQFPRASAVPLPDRLRGQVEAAGPSLWVTGWVVGTPPGAECLTLLCNGQPLEAIIDRLPRADVQRATGAPDVRCGFRVEIPPSCWSRLAPQPRAPLEFGLEVDGFPFGAPWTLAARDLDRVEAALQGVADDGERRLQAALLREHRAAAGAAQAGLPAPALLPALEDDPAVRAARDAVPPRHALRRLWLDHRPLAAAALAILTALHRAGARLPWVAARARRLERALTAHTRLFDAALYRLQAQVADGGSPAPHSDPLDDYLARGSARGWLPNLLFDPRGYVGRLPGRRPPLVNPLLHYALHGRFRGIAPSPWFDASHYIASYPAVRRRRADPLRHFGTLGWARGRRPFPAFDAANADRHGIALREARRNIPDGLPQLGVLLSGLPPGTALPRDRPLPWWPVLLLDGRPAPDPQALLASWGTARSPAAPAAGEAPPPRVDVLVPVYAGLAETLSCLDSVLASRNATPFELVVIDDMSPEPALSQALRDAAARGRLTLLANPRNLGFVQTVNRGLALHPDRDVVILNADTVVHGDWLDRLLAHADGREDVASVTPLSNNATLCSYPATLSENWAPLEADDAALDALAARVNRGRAVSAPTGVGFCMLMTRRALAQVGPLDADHFGRGYGEENDWCQRAERAGLRNLLASDIFVRHRGAVSFGAEADRRMADVLAMLEHLNPGYEARVAAWLGDDPQRVDRARLDAARLAEQDPRPRVLLVSHDRGGGTARHEDERASEHQRAGRGAVRLRPGRRPGTLSFSVGGGILRLPNLQDVPVADAAALADLLRHLGVDTIEVHHLVDHAPRLGHLLADAAALAGIPLEATLHDYYAICPRINLVDDSGVYCGEPDPAGCHRCLRRATPRLPVRDVVAWRREAGALLARADRVRVPDEDVAQRLARYFPDLALVVEPHAADAPMIRQQRQEAQLPPPPDAPVHVVVPGAISAIKGFDVLRDLAREVMSAALPLRLTVLGYSQDDDALEAVGVEVLGRYEDATLAGRLMELAPDIVLIPSVWPETYSYVLSAALAAGLSTAVFDLGAPARRLRVLGRGMRLPLARARDPLQLAHDLLDFARQGRGDPSRARPRT